MRIPDDDVDNDRGGDDGDVVVDADSFYILAMEGRSFGLVTEPKAIEFKNRVWVGDLLVW